MKIPTLEELLDAGAQFGHKPERTHPRAKKYIFGIRDGVNVINLEKTQEKLGNAVKFLSKEASLGKSILFVGAKRQARDIIRETAEKCQVPFINRRWLGGMLTNFETIRKSIKKLENLEVEINSPEFKKLTKNERMLTERKRNRLQESLQGIRDITKTPDILFVIDTAREITAINEARATGVVIVGVCDTDANPDIVDYPIPANDDAQKSIKLFSNLVSEAILEGKKPPRKITKNKEE